MKSWYDLDKDKKKKLRDEYNDKTNYNFKVCLVNAFKIIFYILSFIYFYLLVSDLTLKINGFCTETDCNYHLVLYSCVFVSMMCIAIIFSVIASKLNKHFKMWLLSKNIVK